MKRERQRQTVAAVLLAGAALLFACGDEKINGPYWVYFSTANSGLPSDNVYGVFPAANETWFACDGGVARHSPGEWRVYDESDGLPSDDVFAVTVLPNGDAWAATAAGAARIRGDVVRAYTVADGLPSDRVVSVVFDGANVWLGTDAGLARYDDPGFTVFTDEDGLPSSDVRDIWLVGVGELMIGCSGGAAYFDGVVVRTYTPANGNLPSTPVYSVAAHGGDVWLGTGEGLCLCRAGVLITVFTANNSGLAGDVIMDIGFRDGELWVATTEGASRQTDAGFESFRRGNGLPTDYVLCAAGDDFRQMWLGTLGGGVARFSE